MSAECARRNYDRLKLKADIITEKDALRELDAIRERHADPDRDDETLKLTALSLRLKCEASQRLVKSRDPRDKALRDAKREAWGVFQSGRDNFLFAPLAPFLALCVGVDTFRSTTARAPADAAREHQQFAKIIKTIDEFIQTLECD